MINRAGIQLSEPINVKTTKREVKMFVIVAVCALLTATIYTIRYANTISQQVDPHNKVISTLSVVEFPSHSEYIELMVIIFIALTFEVKLNHGKNQIRIIAFIVAAVSLIANISLLGYVIYSVFILIFYIGLIISEYMDQIMLSGENKICVSNETNGNTCQAVEGMSPLSNIHSDNSLNPNNQQQSVVSSAQQISSDVIVSGFTEQPVGHLIEKRYDRACIISFLLLWLLYSYLAVVATVIFRPQQYHFNPNEYWRWLPCAFLIIYYVKNTTVLYFRTIGAVVSYLGAGLMCYLIHFMVFRFGIIDAAWFMVYYASLGILIYVRHLHRNTLSNIDYIEQQLNTITVETIREFKSDWNQLLANFIKIYLAAGAILGVCMTILLSDVRWREWLHFLNGIRMLFLFGTISALYFIFLVTPLMESVGRFQKLILKKHGVALGIIK